MPKLLVVAIMLLTLFSCAKPPTCYFTEKNLNISVNIEGLKDTLNLSDTLWVTINVPKFIVDSDSQRFELTGELFGEFAMSLRSITEFDLISELPNFQYIDDKGKFHLFTDNPFAYLEFEKNEEESKIRYGMVPQVTGTYLANFLVILVEPNLSFQQVGTDCIHGINYIFTTSSTIPDNNYSIVAAEAVPEFLPPTLNKEDLDKVGGFAFVVRE